MPRFRFTVRRMMITVAILALPLWLLTVFDGAKQDARRAECSFNLHQIAMGVIGFELSNGHFPAGTVPRAGAPPEDRMGWTLTVHRYIDDPDAFLGLANDPAAMPPGEYRIFECPSNPSRVTTGGYGLTHYVGIAGLGTDSPTLPTSDPRAGVFGYDRKTRRADIKDGLGTTMMLAETSTANGPWHLGGPSTVRGLDPARRPYIGPKRQFGGTHRGGASVAFADGSVKFIRETIDLKVFEAISRIAGGEAIPSNWDR